MRNEYPCPPSPTPLTESQQISSNRAKNDVCVLIRLEMDQKDHKKVIKGLKYMKKGVFRPKIPVFCAFFLAEFWVPPPP